MISKVELERRPGISVDSSGGPVVDPTKNVESLVKAESEKRDLLRSADKDLLISKIDAVKELVTLMSANVVAFQNAMRDAETRRIDELAQNRQDFQNTIRDMLAESVRTTSTLVSTQLVQIQATFDTRVSKLEAFQFTQAGRSSVSDPATSDALTRMAQAITNLGHKSDIAAGSAGGAEGMTSRTSTVIGLVISGAVAFVIVMTAIVGVVAFTLSRGSAAPQVVYAPAPNSLVK